MGSSGCGTRDSRLPTRWGLSLRSEADCPPAPPRPGPKQGDLGAAGLPRRTLQWLGMKRMKRTAEKGGGQSLGWPLVVVWIGHRRKGRHPPSPKTQMGAEDSFIYQRSLGGGVSVFTVSRASRQDRTWDRTCLTGHQCLSGLSLGQGPAHPGQAPGSGGWAGAPPPLTRLRLPASPPWSCWGSTPQPRSPCAVPAAAAAHASLPRPTCR